MKIKNFLLLIFVVLILLLFFGCPETGSSGGGSAGSSGGGSNNKQSGSQNKWTNLNPATSPTARMGLSMAYIRNNKIILFGGYSDETWEYDISSN